MEDTDFVYRLKTNYYEQGYRINHPQVAHLIRRPHTMRNTDISLINAMAQTMPQIPREPAVALCISNWQKSL